MPKQPIICGVDEAGRGPLAGPVTAAAVILNPGFPVEILKDSKQLSAAKRVKIAAEIKACALYWQTGWVWPEEIDRLNIHRATLLAMQRALRGLCPDPDRVLIDGAFVPPLKWPAEAVIKGDTLIPAIMAASIIAKTARDKWMVRYSRIEPLYAFEQHKGYPTKLHRRLIKELGLSPIHRKSFTVSFP